MMVLTYSTATLEYVRKQRLKIQRRFRKFIVNYESRILPKLFRIWMSVIFFLISSLQFLPLYHDSIMFFPFRNSPCLHHNSKVTSYKRWDGIYQTDAPLHICYVDGLNLHGYCHIDAYLKP